MIIAIYGRLFNKQYADSVKDLFSVCKRRDLKFSIYRPFYDFLVEELDYKPAVDGFFSNHNDIDKSTECLLSIGGDGTFLEAASIIRDYGIPIAGINLGKLGFLANISKDEITESINLLIKKEFLIDKRSVMKLETVNNLFGDSNFALNDITIRGSYACSMVNIKVFLNDEFLNSYWADGIIVATPTGSTAYSLSVGGPILTPDSRNFVIAPIAPHNLTVRPIVVPDNKTVTLKIDSEGVNFLTSLDYKSKVIDSSCELKIKLADFSINAIRFSNQGFFSTLRNKLMWGLDKRSGTDS